MTLKWFPNVSYIWDIYVLRLYITQKCAAERQKAIIMDTIGIISDKITMLI